MSISIRTTQWHCTEKIHIIIIIIIIYFAQANKLTVKIKLHEQVRQGWGQLL